ncbi:PREDICTED: protein BIG GRAIN 1-like A isoform X2 [Ipomoea nil]|uniref:protein BIG GRAIN 1-like A isoform X2 n=1 Tax=Ipomoea nil TaxID=35883 RepID=UPI000900BB03|nr:PREDICTED: protein BIG GRAIN 1-like A isoform X2 [Ipomoea nil]
MSSSWERPSRGKTPSFSSSLLESIYHSIDESHGRHDRSFIRRNNSIMVEKWVENCTNNKNATPARHLNSDSNSSTDSMASIFSSSEAESSASRSSVFAARKPTKKTAARKSSILSFYGELKKTKQPISPGRRICNFLNSIFTSKNNKPHRREDFDSAAEEWSSVRKSRSMKASTTTAAAPSCLSKTPSSKSKRSVRFCPVNVILNDDSSFRDLEVKNLGNKVVVRGMYNDDEDDGRSCASSDLFELDNIGTAGATHHHHHHHVDESRDELPVYGTTSLMKINQAIASGLFM